MPAGDILFFALATGVSRLQQYQSWLHKPSGPEPGRSRAGAVPEPEPEPEKEPETGRSRAGAGPEPEMGRSRAGAGPEPEMGRSRAGAGPEPESRRRKKAIVGRCGHGHNPRGSPFWQAVRAYGARRGSWRRASWPASARSWTAASQGGPCCRSWPQRAAG